MGELSGDEDVAIHGRFEGTIDVPRKVLVAQGGELEEEEAGLMFGESLPRGVRLAARMRQPNGAARRATSRPTRP